MRRRCAAIGCARVVPDQAPELVQRQLAEFLSANPPWGVQVSVKAAGAHCNWWMTDPNGPAFESAMGALHSGYGRDAVGIGCGGSIGLVGPPAEPFAAAPPPLPRAQTPLSTTPAPHPTSPHSASTT